MSCNMKKCTFGLVGLTSFIQPAHPCSVIRVLAGSSSVSKGSKVSLGRQSKVCEQSASLHSLICIFAGHMSVHLHTFWLKYCSFCYTNTFGPYQVKKCLWTCKKYVDSDHPAHVQSPFLHSVVSNDSVSGDWKPWSDCAGMQADLGNSLLDLGFSLSAYFLGNGFLMRSCNIFSCILYHKKKLIRIFIKIASVRVDSQC